MRPEARLCNTPTRFPGIWAVREGWPIKSSITRWQDGIFADRRKHRSPRKLTVLPQRTDLADCTISMSK
jgi:hypothetical protein